MSQLTFSCVNGPAAAPYLEAVARLRIAVFRDFPYLYAGSSAYEARYLATYSAAPESLFVLAFDGAQVVGASTGVPLDQEEAVFQRPFLEAGYAPRRLFYFGESVLLPAYRGRGAGVRFFAEREAYARRLGRFTHTAFCAVERRPDHAQRPPGYTPLDGFWRRRGYTYRPDLRTTFAWQDLGEATETPKTMVFWMRRLPPG